MPTPSINITLTFNGNNKYYQIWTECEIIGLSVATKNSGDDRGLQEKPSCSPPTYIMNSTVTAVESFRFLGTTISQDLKLDNHIEFMVKKVQQRLYFLRQLRKFNLPQELLIQFYSAIIESVLYMSITTWFSSATKSDLRRLQRVVRTAERIIGTTLLTLQELYLSRVSKRTVKITLKITSSTLPLRTVTVWSTLQSSEHQNGQTQKQFLPSGNPSHEDLTIIMVHTLFIHLSNTHTHLVYTSIAHNIPVQNCPLLYTCTYNCRFVYCYSLFTCSFEFFLLYVFLFCHCNSVALR